MECKLDNITINYEVYGEGKPILMIHGYYLDHRVMLGCMEPIFNNVTDYKRIYIDLPGMGKTNSVDWITNSDKMLEVILDFIDKIIPNENFIIVGQSYGAYLARGVVNKRIDFVDGVLLICPVIIADSSERNVPEHKVIVKDEQLLSSLPSNYAEEFNSSAVVQNKEVLSRYIQEIVSGVSIANDSFLTDLQEKGYEFSFDVDKLQKKYEKPSIIIMGRQDAVVGFKDAWKILNNYPRCSFVVLDKAGHSLQIEQKELFNVLVKEWINRVSEYVNNR